MFDLLQKELSLVSSGLMATNSPKPVVQAEKPKAQAKRASSSLTVEEGKAAADSSQAFVPRAFFALGSPLGMFLSIRLAQHGQKAFRYFRGLQVRSPIQSKGWRFFNIFHPNDPVAYRIEPLLNQSYASTCPRMMPHYGGLRWNQQVHEWWRVSISSTTNLFAGQASAEAEFDGDKVTSKDILHVAVEDPSDFFEATPASLREIIGVDRIDYAIQVSALESINQAISALNSHFIYWQNEDTIHFIIDQLHAILASSAVQTRTAPT